MLIIFTETAHKQASSAPFSYSEDSLAKKWTEESKLKFMMYTTALDVEFSKRLDEFISQENVVFIFDEARHLVYGKNSKPVSNFLHLRRAFTHFPREVGYLCPIAVMTDTTAKISNLPPVTEADASARVSDLRYSLFPPFYTLTNVDIWVDEKIPKTLAQMSDWTYYCRYGRPHWGALAKQISENVIKIQDIMRLARLKVRGREEDTGQMSDAEALAILGLRVCIDIAPESQMSQELVSQHMRLLYYVSEDRQAMITAHCSEPMLVQAAAQLTNFISENKGSLNVLWNRLLMRLCRSLRSGIVDAGYRGELLARILLLMAWDECCIAKLACGETILSSGVFLKAVPLTTFLEYLLLLDENIRTELQSQFDGRHATPATAWVRCTHFLKIDYVPSASQLLDMFRRGAVAITKDLQRGVDLIIPLVICKDCNTEIKESMVSFVLAQLKNRKEMDDSYPLTATSLLTQEAAGLECNEDLPYLSLYMSFGPHLGPEGTLLEMPTTKNFHTRSRSSFKGVQTCLAVFSLSENVYPVLRNSDTRTLLCQIGKCWFDPLVLLQDNVKMCRMIHSMMPCQRLPLHVILNRERKRQRSSLRDQVANIDGDSTEFSKLHKTIKLTPDPAFAQSLSLASSPETEVQLLTPMSSGVDPKVLTLRPKGAEQSLAERVLLRATNDLDSDVEQVAAPRAQVPGAPTAKVSVAPRAKVPAAPRAKVPAARTAKVPAARMAKVPAAPRGKVPAAPTAKVPVARMAKVPTAPRAKVPAAPNAKVPAPPRPASLAEAPAAVPRAKHAAPRATATAEAGMDKAVTAPPISPGAR